MRAPKNVKISRENKNGTVTKIVPTSTAINLFTAYQKKRLKPIWKLEDKYVISNGAIKHRPKEGDTEK